MKTLFATLAIVCLTPALSADAGCNAVTVRQVQQRVVRQAVNYGAVNYNAAVYNPYAAFVAVEQPYYLDLVASQKRQEIQAAKFQDAVDATVSGKLEGIRLEIQKLRTGEATASAPLGPSLTPVPAVPGATPPVPGPAQPTPDEVTKQLTEFLHTKCAECHTGANSKGTGEPFVMFSEDGKSQMTAGKIVRADLMLYSNRMPPVQKLNEKEYADFREMYQTFEREIRAAAIKSDK